MNWPLAFTILVTFGMALSPVWDYDVWFQLACGQAISGLRGLPEHDLFSYTAATRAWDSQEWLSQLIFYGIYTAGGLPGLTVFKALVTTLMFAVVFKHAVRRTNGVLSSEFRVLRSAEEPEASSSQNPDLRTQNSAAAAWLAAAGCAAAAYVMRWHLVERPQIFTMLFLAAELYLLERGRRLWLLVPLTVLWANLHGGSSLLAPGVLVLWFAGRGLSLWRRGEALGPLRSAALLAAAVAAAVALNPAGPGLYVYPFETMSDRMYMMNVREWTPPSLGEHPAFYLFLTAAAALVAAAARGLAAGEILTAAVFAGLALSARRHIPLFCIAVLPAASVALYRIVSPIVRTPVRQTAVAGLTALAAAGTLLLAGRSGDALRLGVKEHLYPRGALRRLADLEPSFPGEEPVRVFGVHQWGGYLLWNLPARFKVFIDGRQLVYGPTLFLNYYQILEDTPEAGPLLERYRPDAFVLDYRYSVKLSRRLIVRNEAALVHWDDSCLVFVRRSALPPRLLRRIEYAAYHPLKHPGPDPEANLADLDRAIRAAPRAARPLVMRASLLLRYRRPGEAHAAINRALELKPARLPVLLTALEVALARRALPEAAALLARAVRADESGTRSALAAARLRLAEGDPGEAARDLDTAIAAGEAWRRKERRPELALADAYRMKAGKLSAAGRGSEAADALRRSGNALYELGRFSEARARYEEGTKEAPTDMRLWHNLGTVLIEEERFAAAARMYRKAINLAPANPDARVGLGVALFRLGRTREAVAAWKKALELAPGHPDATRYLQAVQSPQAPVRSP